MQEKCVEQDCAFPHPTDTRVYKVMAVTGIMMIPFFGIIIWLASDGHVDARFFSSMKLLANLTITLLGGVAATLYVLSVAHHQKKISSSTAFKLFAALVSAWTLAVLFLKLDVLFWLNP